MENENSKELLTRIKIAYIDKTAAHAGKADTLQKSVAKKEKQLARATKRAQVHAKTLPRWTEDLLRPVLEAIKPNFPGWICHDKLLTPMGLGARVSVFFERDDLEAGADANLQGNSIYITFLPGKLENAELCYETGERDNVFRKGTIGELNGYNNVTKPLESIRELELFLQSQIDKNGTVE